MKDNNIGLGEWELTKEARHIADEMVKEYIAEDELQEERDKKNLLNKNKENKK